MIHLYHNGNPDSYKEEKSYGQFTCFSVCYKEINHKRKCTVNKIFGWIQLHIGSIVSKVIWIPEINPIWLNQSKLKGKDK